MIVCNAKPKSSKSSESETNIIRVDTLRVRMYIYKNENNRDSFYFVLKRENLFGSGTIALSGLESSKF